MYYIWNCIEIFFIIKWVTSTPLTYKESLVMKQKWDKCCFRNTCVNNSCFFALRRPSTWAAIRQRCQSRFPDYPSSIDLSQVQNETDLELLSNMVLRKKNSELQTHQVWTSGINCTASKNMYVTKWINSDSPLPEWLLNKISYTNDKALDKGGSCSFLTFTPASNISEIHFQFQDQNAHNLGICEFVLPEEILPTTPSEEIITVPQTIIVDTTFTSSEVKSQTLSHIDTTTTQIASTLSSTITDTTITKYCKKKRKAGIDWPNTEANTIANESCPQGMTGYAQWFCDPTTLQFTPSMPHIQGCSHVWIKELEDNVEKGKDAVDISAKLAEETKKQNMSHGDITALVDLSEKIMHLFSMQKEEENINEAKPKSYIFTDSMVSSMSNILRVETKDAWLVLPMSHQTEAASKILQIVSVIGSHLSCIKKSEKKLQFSVAAENIDLQTFITNKENSDEIVFPQKEQGSNSTILVPANLNWRQQPHQACKDYNSAVGVLYKHVGDFLQDENEKKVVTKVISFSMNNYTFMLPKGKVVTIILRHNSEGAYQHLRCMFWNFSKSTNGQWDDSGCLRTDSNRTHVICSCNHLTNFAVLMDVNNNVEEDDILSVMTYVCCSMSSLCLVITLICFLSIRSLHGRRSIITSNLCLALLLTNLLILFGLDKTGNKILCTVIAAFLHFWILSAFCWMLVEGYHLYKMVVIVFERENQLSVKAYYLFAYGIPSLVVSISLGIKFDYYGGDTYCWLSSDDGLMWSFVGPACAVILINIIVFIMTLRSASSLRIKREQTTLKRIKNWARGSMSVMCLLGLTWCLGLFYINRKLQIFSYIFTLFNGLQGVFIFFFHVLLNEKIRSILNWSGRKRSCWKKYSQQTSSNQLQSKLSTRTSVNSSRRSISAALAIQPSHKSSRENMAAKIKDNKNWKGEHCRSNIIKERATHTLSENGISNFHSQRHYKTRSQSFPEEDCAYNNIQYITRNNKTNSVQNSFR